MTADGEETRARLLTEARDLYVEEGIAAFSLREVARRTRLSPAAVYRHFDSKEALLAEVCAAGFRNFGAYLMRALAAPTPRERLAASARQYLRFALENPRDYRVMFMGAAEGFAVVPPPRTPGAPDPTFQFLIDRVEECIRAKIIRQGDSSETAVVIWAHVHGLASLRLSGHLRRAGTDAEFERFYEHAVERLLAGLAP
jgi:AcrR family transcriptional regulator